MAAEDEHDPLDDIESIPRVKEIDWTVVPKPPALKRETEVKHAAIEWTLRPWSPNPKKDMVTMSDIGLNAKARGGKNPARRPPKPRLLDDSDDS